MQLEDFLKAFQGMSAEDQAKIRAELLPRASEQECCSGAEMDQLKKMMSKMATSKNSMAMCMEMMQMCHDKLSKREACCE